MFKGSTKYQQVIEDIQPKTVLTFLDILKLFSQWIKVQASFPLFSDLLRTIAEKVVDLSVGRRKVLSKLAIRVRVSKKADYQVFQAKVLKNEHGKTQKNNKELN